MANIRSRSRARECKVATLRQSTSCASLPLASLIDCTATLADLTVDREDSVTQGKRIIYVGLDMPDKGARGG